jgi:putative Holliday junction resolvase
VTNVLLQADLSRKKRKKVVDKSAAIYILQGALDFMNRKQVINSFPESFGLY